MDSIKLTVEISTDEYELLTTCVRDDVYENLRKSIDKKLENLVEEKLKEIDKLIFKKLEDEVTVKLDSIVEGVIAEGIQKTDGYGRKNGEMTTVKSLVIARLTDRNYGSGNFNEIVKGQVDKIIEKEFREEINAARASVKDLMTDKLGEKIREAVKASLKI